MLAANMEPSPMTAVAHRSTFFRQSGWLMVANIGGGVLMWLVHFLSKIIGPTEYGLFGVCLAVAMSIPSLPLQMVLAQQTAKALATGHQRELSGLIRIVWIGTFVLWLLVAVSALALQHQILARWGLANPVAFWITLPVVLFCIWMPLFWGVLQGQQNFLWLGWSMIANGVGRLSIAVLAVWLLGKYASSMVTGVLLGLVIATGMAIWLTRALWAGASLPFDWRALLRQVIPLMLGFAAFQFLFTADTIFAGAFFDKNTVGFYVVAGTLSRALMWLVGPLAAVMFPRIVHSAAKAEKTDLMGIVLLGTGVLAVTGAAGLSILGPWVVRFVSGEAFVKVASSLLPWYAGAMIPLSLANVLLNNLLARSLFRVVPSLCFLAVAYGFALTRFHDTPVAVLKTLAFFNLLLLGVCAWFTWGNQLPNDGGTEK